MDRQAHAVVVMLPVNSLRDKRAIGNAREIIEKAQRAGLIQKAQTDGLSVPVFVMLTMIDEFLETFRQDLHDDPGRALSAPELAELTDAASKKLGLPQRNVLVQVNYHIERTTNSSVDMLTLANLKFILEGATDYISGPTFSRRVRHLSRATGESEASATAN